MTLALARMSSASSTPTGGSLTLVTPTVITADDVVVSHRTTARQYDAAGEVDAASRAVAVVRNRALVRRGARGQLVVHIGGDRDRDLRLLGVDQSSSAQRAGRSPGAP